jgi:hypothetical protein
LQTVDVQANRRLNKWQHQKTVGIGKTLFYILKRILNGIFHYYYIVESRKFG